MTRAAWFLGAVGAMALGTWMVSWWAVPAVALVWGWLRRHDAAAPLSAALAGMLAWTTLLVVVAAAAPGGSVMDSVGSAMGVGPFALVAVTVAFPGLLAGAVVGVVRWIAIRREGGQVGT